MHLKYDHYLIDNATTTVKKGDKILDIHSMFAHIKNNKLENKKCGCGFFFRLMFLSDDLKIILWRIIKAMIMRV